MMSTKTGGIADKLAKAFGLCVVVYAVLHFHNGVQEAKAELKEEKSCMTEAAAGQRDVNDCFTMMRNNNRE